MFFFKRPPFNITFKIFWWRISASRDTSQILAETNVIDGDIWCIRQARYAFYCDLKLINAEIKKPDTNVRAEWVHYYCVGGCNGTWMIKIYSTPHTLGTVKEEVRFRLALPSFFAWVDSLALHGQMVRKYMINGGTWNPYACLSWSDFLALPFYNGLRVPAPSFLIFKKLV